MPKYAFFRVSFMDKQQKIELLGKINRLSRELNECFMESLDEFPLDDGLHDIACDLHHGAISIAEAIELVKAKAQ